MNNTQKTAYSFAKVHKKLRSWEWYNNSYMVHLLIHFIISANYEDKDWRGVVIKRGQLPTGLNKLSQETGISIQSLRTCLGNMQKSGEITIKTTNKFSVITLCNYELYQVKGENQQTKQQTINKQTLTPLTTPKEYIEEKNKKKVLSSTADEEKSSAYSRCMEIYSDFIKAINGVKPQINGVTGKSLKAIIKYFNSLEKVKTEDDVVKAFDFILKSYDKWDKFHQGQLKMNQIESNLINILNTIRNGKQQQSKSDEISGIVKGLAEKGYIDPI